jgi:hypothetical protein
MEWANMALEGETADANRRSEPAPIGCQSPWISDHRPLPERARRFAILAVCNNINCETNRVRWRFSTDPNCSFCKTAKGSTRHVLNACPFRLPAYGVRHDNAAKPIVKALKKVWPSASFREDQTPHEAVNNAGTTQRPDICATKGDRALILDFKCPYPTRPRHTLNFVSKVHLENFSKYFHIKEEYAKSFKKVLLTTIIIPSTGQIPLFSHEALTNAGLSKTAATKALRFASIACAKANHFRLGPSLHASVLKTSGLSPV